ncbi:MAG: helix-turn-helix transcriptional regulator [Clostridiaceae bacterium]|nr:helix-turn-helix transcriptional regulator [Clostridiaceae bacterium]
MAWLKELRNDEKLTAEDVAIAAGITRSGYTNIENGKRRPSVEAAKKIAAVLGFSWTRFFESEETE